MIPQITFIGHASYILSCGNIRLLADPWLSGPAFNFGWDLISSPCLKAENLADITHVWFSHEHPDHFSPADLKKIPVKQRAKITILFQDTKDKRVIKFCKALGFKECVELIPKKWQALAPDLEVLSDVCWGGDSWLALKADNFCVVNLNDCVLRERRPLIDIARLISQRISKVDVLLTQFSYANWEGNPDDVNRRKESADEKLRRVLLQIDTLRPESLIPFASFVYFSHEENFYLNDGINTLSKAVETISAATRVPVVGLYPGDRWTVGDNWDGTPAAIDRYAKDMAQRLETGPVHRSKPLSAKDLERSAATFFQQLWKKNPRLGLLSKRRVRVQFFESDLPCYILTRHSMTKIPSDAPIDTEAITLSAESLKYCFETEWGANTLHVNGRFRATSSAAAASFFDIFWAATRNKDGEFINLSFFARKLVSRVRQKVLDLT
jgi:UDP-MurNAc hydroxylase